MAEKNDESAFFLIEMMTSSKNPPLWKKLNSYFKEVHPYYQYTKFHSDSFYIKGVINDYIFCHAGVSKLP